MADRVRQLMKRSGSSMSSTKGSVNHIGTTPYRFKIDFLISYAEHVKSVDEVCVTWERRGKTQATNVAKVVDGKAIFRHLLSMECTLFRKPPNKSKNDRTQEDILNFDEKKAKLYLRKGGPQGKAVAKLSMNISDYIKGATSTVFADMKLSDGTVLVTKIEANMIALDKKKTFGSWTGSGVSDVRSVDDSLCGDEEDLENAQRLSDIVPSAASCVPTTPRHEISPMTSPSKTPLSNSDYVAQNKPLVSSIPTPSRLSNQYSLNLSSSATEVPRALDKPKLTKSAKQRVKESGEIKESPSLTEKFKNRFKVSGKKDKQEKCATLEKTEAPEQTISEQNKHMSKEPTQEPPEIILTPRAPSSSFGKMPGSKESSAEVKELKKLADALKKENSKLKKAKNAALEEIEALRFELKSCEEQLENLLNGKSDDTADAKLAKLQAKLKDKDKKIGDLKTQNEHLLEEMEEQHVEMRTVSKRLEEQDRERIQQDIARHEQIRQEQARLKEIRQEQMHLDKARVEQARIDQERLDNVRREQERLEQMQRQSLSIHQVPSVANDCEEVKTLRKKVAELELALQREPTFMDVVNELKVLKMTVALANMEKEQALFELQNMKQQLMRQES